MPITTKVVIFKPRSWQGVLDATLCDKVCQWFSPGTPVSSTNKIDRHDMAEILLDFGIKHHKPTNTTLLQMKH